MAAAVDWLRTKLGDAAKKAGRVAADILVGVVLKARRRVSRLIPKPILLAGNETFQSMVGDIATVALGTDNHDGGCWRLIIRVPVNRLKRTSLKWSARLVKT